MLPEFSEELSWCQGRDELFSTSEGRAYPYKEASEGQAWVPEFSLSGSYASVKGVVSRSREFSITEILWFYLFL